MCIYSYIYIDICIYALCEVLWLFRAFRQSLMLHDFVFLSTHDMTNSDQFSHAQTAIPIIGLLSHVVPTSLNMIACHFSFDRIP